MLQVKSYTLAKFYGLTFAVLLISHRIHESSLKRLKIANIQTSLHFMNYTGYMHGKNPEIMLRLIFHVLKFKKLK